MRFRIALILGLIVGAAAGTGAGVRAAEPSVKVENVHVGIQDTYKVGTWTMVRVDLMGGPAPFEGTLEVEAPDEDGTPTLVVQGLNLAPRQAVRVAAYIRPGNASGEDIVARVRDRRGRTQGPDARAVAGDGGPPKALDPIEEMIVSLGHPEGVKLVPGLGAFNSSTREAPLVVVEADPKALPGRWIGFEGVSVIVLDANDPDALEAVRARIEAIRQWVRNGGHLVVCGASRGQEARDLLGGLLPALPNGTTRLNDLGEIESYAGSKNNPIPGKSMTVAVLEEAEARGGRVLSASTATPLIVRGASGFGRVTIIGLNVDQKPFSDWKDKPLFWVRALDLKPPPAENDANSGGSLYQSHANDLAGILHRGLDRPPGVTPVPFGWVAFFVFLYIVLIGPGDYFFLKHIVKRMEWTWLTFPLIVITTSAVAYTAAYALKGTTLKVMKADAIDVDQVSGHIRGTTWMTLFSPQNRDYNVSISPRPLTAEAPARPVGLERLVTWFGAPTATIGGGSGARLGNAPYFYTPEGQAEGLEGVRIPIWSTKSFSARWSAPLAAPLIEADLLPSNNYDRLDGTITNISNHTLKDAVLFHGGQVYDQLGTIAPNATVRIDLASRTRPISGYLAERAKGLNALVTGQFAAPAPGGNPQSAASSLADLLRVVMFRNALNDAKATTPGSVPLRYLDLSGQLALDRPMLVAALDADAASELLLTPPADAPSIEQTTILRVVLPLRKPSP